MNEIIMNIYKVTWKHTANTYVVCRTSDLEQIKQLIRKNDYRCDDIVKIEPFELQMFDGDEIRKDNYVQMFMETTVF